MDSRSTSSGPNSTSLRILETVLGWISGSATETKVSHKVDTLKLRRTSAIHTDYAILQRLILLDGIPIPLTLVRFTSEVLDSFVVQKAIGMYASCDLHAMCGQPTVVKKKTADRDRG